LLLLLFGPGLGTPFIVFKSNLFSMLMDRNPVIIYIGTAILGKVGGEITITETAVLGYLDANEFLQY